MRIFALPPFLVWLILALIVGTSFSFVMVSGDSPEKVIPGRWKETEWIYEKVEHDKKSNDYKSISENIKQEIMDKLVIHEAETWNFTTDGKLKLEHPVVEEAPLNWKIKGRGHILVLTHVDGREEHYSIRHLSKETIEIHFESDIQARGIVKITLKRLNDDVDK